ncbi:Amidase [Parasponia andersonii]|uniref:Amidase n=1 Tax=Parasponia andersonii TaxID=3476 RepID=A0A2P5C239_PARAD|nr:Amidase [Parasponia andersonii]
MRVNHLTPSLLSPTLILLLLGFVTRINGSDFRIDEATVADIQRAFADGRLTSRQLVDFYIDQIERLNPLLRGVLEVNPDARSQAEKADREREETKCRGGRASLGELHGVPVLLKDSIATKDALNTTAGSYALLGSVVPRDATVAERLRAAGAVILGKASLTEWYGTRSSLIPSGWCARGGQAVNPYNKSGDPCGSSSGPAISVAANMVTVSLGTETDGSIICPADHNSVVGIKPTVGLTSRAGVVPISPRQDSIGPICRTVSDAVYVLDAIVGYDLRDHEATKAAAKFIPKGGYKQFLKKDGLKGKRLGIVRNPFLDSYYESSAISTFETHLSTLRQRGATIIDHLEIANIDIILDPYQSGEALALITEFKVEIKKYLGELVNSPVRSLSDIIAFNSDNSDLEMTNKYGQEEFILSEMTSGIGEDALNAIKGMKKLSEDGFDKLMKENELDAVVTLGWAASTMLAIGGYPAISVPAGFESSNEMPFGICFGGLKGTEPKLIEIAYAFEQATKARRPPPILQLGAMELK